MTKDVHETKISNLEKEVETLMPDTYTYDLYDYKPGEGGHLSIYYKGNRVFTSKVDTIIHTLETIINYFKSAGK